MANLSIELAKANEAILQHATDYGLDFFTTIFEVLEFDELNQVASYGGFPVRYPHWSFGMEYEQLSKGYQYGLSKIYELVINNDPCYAYLMKSNALVDQKLVMAHVYGHCDFFKNNTWFSKTNRKMIDQMANHSTRVRRYIDKYGFDKVETFLDACLSIDTLIDPHSVFSERKSKPDPIPEEDDERVIVPKLKSKSYMDKYINPPEFLEEQRQKILEKRRAEKKFPPEPEKDILGFLMNFAPLSNWQSDVLNIIRQEAYYFAPQGQTKIMNEGWASYWHSTIMTQKALKGSELIDFADHHSGTMSTAGGQLNPYKLGIELFRHIEERWNKGRFGKDYDDCDDIREKSHWNKETSLGREKIFEVRKVYNDLTFLDEFLTPEFCNEQKLFMYGFNPKTMNYEIFTRQFETVKRQLLFALTNSGRPAIYVEDGNFENRGELLLKHRHEGVDLRLNWAQETISNLQRIWNRPVNLLTFYDGKEKLFTFDGKDHKDRTLEGRKKAS